MKKACLRAQGFTLVELVVTISIFVVVSTLVFANYPKFKSQLSLKKTSQEIAFAVREAQVYSLSVKEYNGTFPGYGVHFDINKPDTIILFADADKNFLYNEEIDGIVKKYEIKTNDSFSSLCGDKKKSFPGVCELSQIDAVYLRPNPIITLKGRDKDGFIVTPNFSDVEIGISSSGGTQKNIIIWISGQITIE